MASTHVEKDINAPVDKVWDLITDMKRWEEWNTLFTKWKSEPPATVEQGSEVTAVLTIMGMANTITLTVDEYEKPTGIALSGTGMAGAKVKLTMSLVADGDNSTLRAESEFVSAMMVGAIGGAVERAAKKELEASLEKVAAIVE